MTNQGTFPTNVIALRRPRPAPTRAAGLHITIAPEPDVGWRLEVNHQPLLTRESRTFCARVQAQLVDPRYGGVRDPAAVVAERIRRWATGSAD